MSSQPPDGAAPHVLVDDVEAPVLSDDARHHLDRVRRLRDGDALTVTDGRGAWRAGRFRGRSEIDPDGPVITVPAPEPEVTVAFALTKSDKPDLVVQKLTELGVDRIVPFRADRSVVRWDETKAARQHERLVAIARSACEQSHRCWLPVVEPVTDVADLAGRGAVRLDRGPVGVSLDRPVVAVGPEGGWSDHERAALPDTAGLGPHVLRAETAAITAGALLGAMRSGWAR
ncbi:16S rRNA (uracil(1498)-N(3))-methyltransferase [Acidimicrobiia bacterium EGI L10123]|uniref:RsmE family RNA methyltransferase n=1 Tax=Salinilacustrithrix flava TaxID=2957203 RepID=UPI003D7C2228|nr:16S rRNA (uracil(1498)-N(3))-methyltransferase [Acidimicrobiia bacterium EGI L10123]